MADKSSTRKRSAAPKARQVLQRLAKRYGNPPERERADAGRIATEIRLQAITDCWEALDDADRADGGVGLEVSLQGGRVAAKQLGVPYLAAKLLNRELTSEDLEEWERWAPRTQLLTICRVEGDEVKS